LKRLHGFRGAATLVSGRHLADLAFQKNALRAAMRRRRRALVNVDAGARAAGHLPIERLGRSGIVAGYHPRGAEIDPWPLMRRLAALGARLVLPVTVSHETPLVFRLAGDPGDFVPDAFGILAPPPAAAELAPDLVIAPILAFDRAGARLGQGGGFYDRTLAALRAAGPVFVLGLAYAGQEVEAVPADAHDQRLDAILTEIGYREF